MKAWFLSKGWEVEENEGLYASAHFYDPKWLEVNNASKKHYFIPIYQQETPSGVHGDYIRSACGMIIWNHPNMGYVDHYSIIKEMLEITDPIPNEWTEQF